MFANNFDNTTRFLQTIQYKFLFRYLHQKGFYLSKSIIFILLATIFGIAN